MEKNNNQLFNLDFLKDDQPQVNRMNGKYKVMVADDDEEVHVITKMILSDFTFEGMGIEVIDAYSGAEAIELLKEHPDTAVIFLDVVMENVHSGLEVASYIRKTLENHMIRIILRTGQPGEAPEETVIREYDINDYRLKTEMTVKRLFTTLYTAIRGYRDLQRIEKHKKGLEKIIETSADLFQHNSLGEFLKAILYQLAGFYNEDSHIVYAKSKSGLVTIDSENEPYIVAATGKYEPYVGRTLKEIENLNLIQSHMNDEVSVGNHIEIVEGGFMIKSHTSSNVKNIIYIEGDYQNYDFELIQLFLSNYAVAVDNFMLSNMISTTQKEIIITLGEVVENHFEETGGHVKRISEMMYAFALHANLSYSEAEVLKIASTMHDIGKIAIPDAIIKKRGLLTPEEREHVEHHPAIGHRILSKSNLHILKIAAEIALRHHEKYDGSGYPGRLKGKNIPLNARLMAIVDVYDAMTHKRVYKEACTKEEALEYIIREKNRHFDPKLVDLFIENFDDIVKIN